MPTDIESRARDMGWLPAEEFRGDPAKWRPAEEFVERGETLLPIVKANTRKLEQRLAVTEAENRRLAQLFAASQESIVEMQSVHEETLAASLARQRREIMAQIASAREEGDVLGELELQEQLAELRAKPKEKPVEKPAPTPAPTQQQGTDPDFAAWQRENPWFGTDARRTQLANGIGQQLRADPENDGIQGREFYDLVTRTLEEREASRRGAGVSKVSGGRPSGGEGGGSSGGSKSFASLPPEAKEACNSRERKMVGEGKPFKDSASWQAYYAKIYFKGEE